MHNQISWFHSLITAFLKRVSETLLSAILTKRYFAITKTCNNIICILNNPR